MSTSTTMRELAALEDPKMREANERRGDDHGVNLTPSSRARQATQDTA
jgi:hypothetical protein